ncbi:hypothetical protein, variant [Verruconis gallopava]|uniref:Peptidase S59 domain-containing protein n=1 Tax=Verruconis gallopava TaxID=253628 RepID=A0A0D2A6W6_9PEZI|nr:hypothetical protein, variant [Verruconis gallopava]KIW02468.1 hypothetical protein, variant [Verruconis gallopava]
MSGFGFGGFGQNNQSSTSGFGGFGSNNNNSGGFGSSGGAFGQNKTGFGTTTTTSGGGLFGGSTTTSGSGFGGFGSTTSGGFGSTNTGGGLFGQQNKPATGFGSGSTSGLFGSSSGGFGSGTNQTQTTGFGGFGSGTTTQNNGTGQVQFSETTEKDANATGNQINKFQSITTMDAYKNFSFEELRLVDYQQNRKQGGGQAGAFGAGSTFGGFGSNNNTTGGFGTSTGGGLFGQQNNNTSTGFGSSNSGGLFGAKPATGGLFGSTSSSAPSGGLFGTSSGNTGFGGTGFGANNTSSSTTGGLFGSANNQAKPLFGGFGSTQNTGFGSSSAGGFGASTQTSTGGGGLFGGSTTATTGGFGSSQPASTGFSFGQNNQTNQTTQSGGLFGGGGFGQNNQSKPGGLFGSSTTTNTGGGLFGNTNNQTQQSGGLFGSAQNNTQQSGGLFGSKPATGGLFGNTTSGTTGGLFGNTQQQTNTGGLFGQTNNQQSGGLFGAKPTTSSTLGGGLFGNTQQNSQQAAGSSLFGGSQQPAQQTGGSVFGSSLLAPQQPQQPGTLTASLMQNPYGNDALFANIGTPTQSVGPLATPLASSQKNKKQALIPAYKISPAASSRLTTPQKRPSGYGFSYSTYGTPGSALPGSPFGHSTLLSPGYARGLNKSMSTSNLRNSFTAEDTILTPGAFSSTVRGGTGRLKKLNIDRSLNSVRKPLFGTVTPEPRKSVSFDTSSEPKETNGTSSLGLSNGALVRTESPTSDPETSMNGSSRSNGSSSQGKELAVVPEDSSPESAPAVKPVVQVPRSHADKAAGGYWTKPSLEEIQALPQEKKANFENFEVGCENMGKVIFHKVDFTRNIPLDKIMGDIVFFEKRKVSVYGDNSSVSKPPPGQGLNVPSTITLADSWPRANAGATEVLEKKGPRYNKHINRLKRIPNTEFVDFNGNTGEFTFKVEHYTTYGVPDDDDDESILDSTMLTDDVPSPTPLKVSKLRAQQSSPNMNSDTSLPSPPESAHSSPDDTFDFKKGKRKQLPGQFDEEAMEEDVYDEEEEITGSLQSFLGQRSVGSSVDDTEDANELGLAEDQEMAGSFPVPARTTEPLTAPPSFEPKSILKNSTVHGTPLKTGSVLFGDDWTEQLQRTVSPKKQDRAALRANQSIVYESPEQDRTPKVSERTQPFATTVDIMNSLFNQSTRSTMTKFGDNTSATEYPNKRIKIRGAAESEELDNAFHQAPKPHWGPDGTLVYIAGPMAPSLGRNSIVEKFAPSIIGERNDVRFAKLSGSAQAGLAPALIEQKSCTDIIYESENIPHAVTSPDFEFAQFAEVVPLDNLAGRMEQRAWELAHILFDAPHDVPSTVAGSEKDIYLLRLRKDKVSEFWKKIVRNDVQNHVARAETLEEKAFAYLTGGLIEEACNVLVEGKNFHLATLVAQIGCDRRFRESMSTQLESWRILNSLAEFEDSIRAIYELLAGNTCICRGQSAAGYENVTSTFAFSKRFNLDWRRSFGLRLWYGIDPEQDVTEAVLKYLEDLKDGREEVRPVPWFTEQKISTNWIDEAADTREDLLWSMLQLYGGDSFDLAVAFAPESVSGNPIDARLSFQLITLFQAQNVGVAADLGPETVDSLASTFAADLATGIKANPFALVSAVWVLLHLSDANARKAAICSLLDQHASLIDAPDGKIFSALREIRIPEKWIYLSKALHAHAVTKDAVAEAENLLEAGEWEQAHEVVCRTVGPVAVIENDSDQLRELLGGLHDPVCKGSIYAEIWDRGAGIYYDFVEMRDLETQKGQRWKELVSKLAKALQRVNTEGALEGKELRERAALQIMGNVVAGYLADGQLRDGSERLKVPLTEDKYLMHSRALGLEYFKALAATS